MCSCVLSSAAGSLLCPRLELGGTVGFLVSGFMVTPSWFARIPLSTFKLVI